MNLAYAEMFLWLGDVFRQFGSKEVRFPRDEGIIELVDTDSEDVELAVDYYVPEVKASSKQQAARASRFFSRYEECWPRSGPFKYVAIDH